MTKPIKWALRVNARPCRLTPLEEKVIRMHYGVAKQAAAVLDQAGQGHPETAEKLALLEARLRRQNAAANHPVTFEAHKGR